jgi:hypothetical protein
VTVRLVDLDASFVSSNGVRTGVQFLCPACRQTRIVVPFAKPDGGPPDPSMNMHGVLWRHTGDTLDTLTLSPSVDARHTNFDDDLANAPVECRWHGWVTSGAAIPC